MKKILYYDCFAGISGDMNLGALIDLGVDKNELIADLEKLNISGFHLKVEPDIRKGISGTKATVVIENQENEKHRHLRHVKEIVNGSTLSDKVKQLSLKIFGLIAVAEAKVHNISVEKVHFHEVGALDSIADIVGAAICLDKLNVDEVVSSPIQLGGGMVKCAHGLMPVPAPATAEIVKDSPVKTGLTPHEATTPTGAAIIVATADRFVTQSEFKIIKTGYGIGQRDTELPNILRVYLAEEATNYVADVTEEKATMLECNIDDMNPEWFDNLSQMLFEAGASEVFVTPVLMKKSRSASMLSVLSKPELVSTLKGIIFKHSTTIGLREYTINKSVLRRETVVVETSYGEVSAKKCFYDGKVVNIKPEYDNMKALAIANDVPLQTIYAESIKLLS